MTFRSRFHQINLVFTLLLAFMAGNQVISRILSAGSDAPWFAAITEDSAIYAAFVIAFLVLTFVRESRLTQIAQIAFLTLLGAVTVAVVAPKELGGDLNFILAAALAYKYNLLRTRPVAKISAIMGILIVARISGVLVFHTIAVDRVLNQLVITVVSVPILYWLFESELLQIRREKQRLEELLENNQPFVEFGQNVTGIVHDFKNDLGLFDTFGQYLALSEGEPVESSQIRLYRRYVKRLATRIGQIMTVTQASRRYAEESGELQELLRSTVYVFQSNLEFKRVVTFELVLPDTPIYVRLPPAPVISILENLIRNSCEAMTDLVASDTRSPGDMTLSVVVERDGDGVVVTVSDTGPGLPFCDECRKDNCLYCPEIAPGRSSKGDGSGIGLVSVRRHAEQYGIPVHMRSRPGEGVITTLRITGERILDGPEHEASPHTSVGVDG